MRKEDAIEFFGSKIKLAKALGIAPSAVTQWPDVIPIRRAYEIEKISKGKLKAPEFKQAS